MVGGGVATRTGAGGARGGDGRGRARRGMGAIREARIAIEDAEWPIRTARLYVSEVIAGRAPASLLPVVERRLRGVCESMGRSRHVLEVLLGDVAGEA